MVMNDLLRGLNFYIVIYRKKLKKSSSQDLLRQMGQYLAWIVPSIRRCNFVQLKSLESYITKP